MKFVKAKGVTKTVVNKVVGGKVVTPRRVVNSSVVRTKHRHTGGRRKVRIATSGVRMARGTRMLILSMGPRFCTRAVTRVGSTMERSRLVVAVTPNGALT